MHVLYFLVSTVGALVVVTVSRGMICPVMGRVVDGFCTTYLFVKYIRQKKVSSMMKVKGISSSSCFLGESHLPHPCGKQQERTGFQCCWQCGDTEKSPPCT